ncbi:MAG: hypothetical protein ABIJ92_04705 [Candidatus Aenigmatarchaeota archaeon]
MKGKILILILCITLVFLVSLVGSQNDNSLDEPFEGSYLSDKPHSMWTGEATEIENTLKDFYMKENVKIVMYVYDSKKEGRDIESLAEYIFRRYYLDILGDPTLNTLIIYDLQENKIRLTHSKICSLDTEDVLSIQRSPDVSGLLEAYDYNTAFSNLIEKLKILIKRKQTEDFICTLDIPTELVGENCEVLHYSGDPHEKINLVFIGNGFENSEEFENHAWLSTKSILEFDVFSDYSDLFNFYLNKKISNNFGLESSSSKFSYAVKTELGELSAECAGSYTIIISNAGPRGVAKVGRFIYSSFPTREPEDLALYLLEHQRPGDNFLSANDYRISAFPGYAFIRTSERDDYGVQKTVIHELGHMLFGLADEYTLENYGDRPHQPNCAPDIKTARRWWGNLEPEGAGYFQGCSYVDDNIRSTETSIMRNSEESNVFGPVNERQIRAILDEYKRLVEVQKVQIASITG